MRIRNSRPCFSLPLLAPEAVSRSKYFRSKALLYSDERFLVEDTNRHIGWSFCPLRKPSNPGLVQAQQKDLLQPVMASEETSLNQSEKKDGKENFMQELPNVSQRLEDGNENRKSNFSGTCERNGVRSTFSAHVVLALPASSSRPDRELPLKKRRLYSRSKLERKDEVKEAKKSAVEINAVLTVAEKNNLSDHDDSQRSKGMNCLLNSESSVLCPMIDSHQGHGEKEERCSEEKITRPEGMQRRRSGRSKRVKDCPPMEALSAGNSRGKVGRTRRRGRPRKEWGEKVCAWREMQ